MFGIWLRILKKGFQSCASKSVLRNWSHKKKPQLIISGGAAQLATGTLENFWLSILYHVTDRHRWKDCDIFKTCHHRKLTKKERATKPFLKVRSTTVTTLERVAKGKSLLSGLKYLTNFNHAGTWRFTIYYIISIVHSVYISHTKRWVLIPNLLC